MRRLLRHLRLSWQLNMSPEKLARMANQIATFFRSQDPEAAPAMVADHLAKFWEPRMRNAIMAHSQSGSEDLDPVVLQAIEILADRPVRP